MVTMVLEYVFLYYLKRCFFRLDLQAPLLFFFFLLLLGVLVWTDEYVSWTWGKIGFSPLMM